MSDAPGPSPWLAFRSTVLDRLAAAVLVLVLGPVALVLGWWVRRHDGGPALIRLDRVGQGGSRFGMWKLRSMRVAVDAGAGTLVDRGIAGGSAITAVDDHRVTPAGAWLRRWRLDELPQLVNVLTGDMALFGPRPETPSLVDVDDPAWTAVLAARPGITGPTQLVVEGWEAEVLTEGSQEQCYRHEILPVKLAVDRWYVEHASPRLDLAVAWSMFERFLLGRRDTSVQRMVRAEVAAARVPVIAP